MAAAAGTTVTEVFGAGPVIAATIIAAAGDVSRFPGRDHFAACNGTAPIEVSSGQRKIYRLSTRGNRRLNHAIHTAAVSQVSHRRSAGVVQMQPVRATAGLGPQGLNIHALLLAGNFECTHLPPYGRSGSLEAGVGLCRRPDVGRGGILRGLKARDGPM